MDSAPDRVTSMDDSVSGIDWSRHVWPVSPHTQLSPDTIKPDIELGSAPLDGAGARRK